MEKDLEFYLCRLKSLLKDPYIINKSYLILAFVRRIFKGYFTMEKFVDFNVNTIPLWIIYFVPIFVMKKTLKYSSKVAGSWWGN